MSLQVDWGKFDYTLDRRQRKSKNRVHAILQQRRAEQVDLTIQFQMEKHVTA